MPCVLKCEEFLNLEISVHRWSAEFHKESTDDKDPTKRKESIWEVDSRKIASPLFEKGDPKSRTNESHQLSCLLTTGVSHFID